MTLPVFELGDTLQFTWQSCVAPDAAPRLSIREPFASTFILSEQVQTSGTLNFYQFFTMPNSVGIYGFTWVATKTIGSSAYPFVDRGQFKVEETKV